MGPDPNRRGMAIIIAASEPLSSRPSLASPPSDSLPLQHVALSTSYLPAGQRDNSRPPPLRGKGIPSQAHRVDLQGVVCRTTAPYIVSVMCWLFFSSPVLPDVLALEFRIETSISIASAASCRCALVRNGYTLPTPPSVTHWQLRRFARLTG
jgi:hypothetical protein